MALPYKYFQPLIDYLDEQQELHKYPIDWNMKKFEDMFTTPDGDNAGKVFTGSTGTVVIGLTLSMVKAYFFQF